MAWKSPRRSGTFTYSSSLAEKDGNIGIPASNRQYKRVTQIRSSEHSRKASRSQRHTGPSRACIPVVPSKAQTSQQLPWQLGSKTWWCSVNGQREREREQKYIDLYYHITQHLNVKQYIQNETAREGGNLTWDKLVEEAKYQECVGKVYAGFRGENGGGGMPSYGDPALAADAISRGYKKPQPRLQTPSGGKGNSQQQCQRCGKCNGCRGKKGTCPAWGKECDICKGAQQRQGKGKKQPPGKAKAKYNAHSMKDGPIRKGGTS